MATFYVDPTKANDLSDGLSPASAKKTFKAAYTAAAAGDTILLRAGYCHDPVNGYFPRIQKSNLTVRAYDLPAVVLPSERTTKFPILDALVYENEGTGGTWFHEGGGVWSKKIAGVDAKPKRMWVGCANNGVLNSQRYVGTAKSRTPNAAADTSVDYVKSLLSTIDVWHPSGSALGYKTFVYTGSTTVAPPEFYNGLAFVLSDGASVGATEGIFINKCNNSKVYDLHVRGPLGECGIIVAYSGDGGVGVDGCIIDNCVATCVHNGGFCIRNGFENTATIPPVISNSYIINCYGETTSSQHEQDKTTAYTHLSFMDMYIMTGNLNNCHIWDFESKDSAHVGAAFGGYNTYKPVNCTIQRGNINFSSWVSYARGLATGTAGANCWITGCTISGQNVRSQFCDGRIIGNKWINMRASIRKAGTSEWCAVESYIRDRNLPLTGPNNHIRYEPTELIIAHNTVIEPKLGTGNYPVLITSYANSGSVASDPNVPLPAGRVKIHNNIITDTQSRPWIGCFKNGADIGVQSIKNNIIYSGSGNPASSVKWLGTIYDINASAIGCSGNLAANPMLDSGHIPMDGSPAIAAGLWLGFASEDLAGNPYNDTNPTIGAYEIYVGSEIPPDPVPPTDPAPPPPVVIGGGQAQQVSYYETETKMKITFLESPRFNTEIRYGMVGGPEFNTDVTVVHSGAEYRNSNWLDSRGKWQVGDDLFDLAQKDALIAFFRERKGRAGGFRFKDWSDYAASKTEGILVPVVGKPNTFQLTKRYINGDNYVDRPIVKPVPGSLQFWENGELSGTLSTINDVSQSVTMMVATCYAAIGRIGIGAGDTEVDGAGFDFWVDKLVSGTVQAKDFIQNFLYAASVEIGTPEAAIATEILASINSTILSEGNSAYVTSLVMIAYAAIGRITVGTGDNNVDILGFRFWAEKLNTGAISTDEFLVGFLNATKNYAPQVSIDYSQEVSIASELLLAYVNGPYKLISVQPEYQATLVLTAYAAVGRRGFGNGASYIDSAGYNYWLDALATGTVTDTQFFSMFISAAASYTGDSATIAQALKADIEALTSTGTALFHETMVIMAYAAIEHFDIGTGENNIDSGGYNFWTSKLDAGEVSKYNFFQGFMNSVSQYVAGVPVDYSQEIALATSILGAYETNVQVDYTTGYVKITDSAAGTYTWSGEFDVPARFDTDTFNATFMAYRDSDGEALFMVTGLTIVELR